MSAVTARRELLGRGSVYTVASAIQAASVLLVLPVATRVLGAEEFGVAAAGLVVTQLLAIVAGLGLNGSVMLEYFDERSGEAAARRLIGTALVAAMVVVALAELTGPLWSGAFAELEYGTELRLATWTALPLAVLASSQALLRSQDRAGAYVVATVIATAGGQALGVTAVLMTSGRAIAYLAGVLAGAVLGASAGLVAGGCGRPHRGDREVLQRSFRFGLALLPHALAMYAVLAVDRLIIEGVLGLEAAGRYQVAYLIGAAGLSLLTALNNAWAPIVLAAREDRRWVVLAGTTRLLEDIVPAVVAVIALGAPVLLAVAAPPDFGPVELARVVAVVAMSTLPYLWYLARVHVLTVHRDAAAPARTTPVAVVLAVVANLLVVDRTGLLGAAVVTVASYAFLAWRVHVHATRHARPPWDHASSVRAALLVAVTTALALALPASGTGLVLRALAAATVIVLCIARFLATEPDDVDLPSAVPTPAR